MIDEYNRFYFQKRREKYYQQHKKEINYYRKCERELKQHLDKNGKVPIARWKREKEELRTAIEELKVDNQPYQDELAFVKKVQSCADIARRDREMAEADTSGRSEEKREKQTKFPAFHAVQTEDIFEENGKGEQQPELEAEWDDGGWQKQVLRLLRELYACPEHDTEPYELMLRSHIMGIWDRLNRQSIRVSRRDEPGETGRLEPVVKYMKDNFAYEITLSELAEMLPMSEGQFCRIFKQTMKMSPMQYLMRYRILQSCRLLQDTDKKIGEIANLSGFNNISYFNKVFLQTIGCTPREYRSTGNY